MQGDQLNMALSGTLEKVTYPVNTCTVAYTGQVTLYKVPEKHNHDELVILYVTREGFFNYV